MEKLNKNSLDIVLKMKNKFEKNFPELFNDGFFSLDKLKSLLGELIEDDTFKYQFTWRGKNIAIKLAQTPSTATLRPSRSSSKYFDLTENLYIEGDNLETLKQLQKTYFGKIDVIYIDPPYNTGGEFVYKDDFKDSLKNYKESTNQLNSSNPESSGRYHTDWLNMMYPRLMVAKNLIANDGLIFISIDENEIANLKKILQEIFGETEALNTIIWSKRNAQNDASFVQKNHEYILVFKVGNPPLYTISNSSKEVFQDGGGYYYLGSGITTGGEGGTLKRRPNLGYTFYYNPNSKDFLLKDDYDHDKCKISDDESTVYTNDQQLISKGYIPIRPPKKGDTLGCWTWNIEKATNEKDKLLIIESRNGFSIRKKEYIDKSFVLEERGRKFVNVDKPAPLKSIVEFSSGGGSKITNALLGHKIFENSKPVDLIKYLVGSYKKKNAVVLDFFSGSATTAHAVMQLNAEDGGNRKFIMVQLPEKTDEKSEAYKAGYKNICEIGKERIRRAGEQIKKELIEKKQKAGMLDENITDPNQLDIGFKVFKLDETNIKPWDSSLEVDEKTLLSQIEVIKEKRTKEDVLYEILLKYGVFNESVKELSMNGQTIYSIAENYMIVNLNERISSDDIKSIAQLKPSVVVFLENGFADDNQKINAEATLKHQGIEDVKCI